MSIESWNKRLAKARELHKEKKHIWWSRKGFHGDYAGIQPKWHLFADRVKAEENSFFPHRDYEFTWKARCGYEHTFYEGLLEDFPRLNLSKKPPKIEAQCKRCRTEAGMK